MNRTPTWNVIEPWPGETTVLRYVAISPHGQLSAWPEQRWRRAWMLLRGWALIEDSTKPRRRLGWLRATPKYEMRVEAVSLEEIQRRYGKQTKEQT